MVMSKLPDSSPLTVPVAAMGPVPPSRQTRRVPRRRFRAVKESAVDRVFLLGVYILLTLFLAVVLIPLLHILASSFSSPAAVSSGRVFLWPVDFSLKGYEVVLSNPQILRGYANSLMYTVAGTLISVILTIAIAYPLSRVELFGRNLIMTFVVFTMLFAGGLIPTYLVVQSLGLINSPWALLLPQAIGVWQVIIARTYLRSGIPAELYEAAQLDGTSEIRFLWSIVLPLAKPMIAVIALMYAIGQWNSYFDALMYLKDSDLFPLQIVLRDILILGSSGGSTDLAGVLERQQLANLLKFSLIVVACVPVLVLYPFVARHFTKGVMLGALKG